jgi:hypothetical protein
MVNKDRNPEALLRLLLTMAIGLGILMLLHRIFGPVALSGGGVVFLGAMGREIVAYGRAHR